VYRFLHQHQLMTSDAPLPLDCDGKRRKCYLIAFIDDHSRLVPHAQDEASLLRRDIFAELHTLTQFEQDSKP